jgi:hypothetical protein
MFTFDMAEFGGSPCFTYLDYFKEGSERFDLDSILALDLSKSSTGIAYWDGQTLETFNLKSSIKDLDSPYSVGLRMQELKDFILVKVLKGQTELDMLCVEEALLGNNAKTSSVAYALNFTLDYLLAEGVLKAKRFFRVSNKTWKATLRSETGVAPLKKAVWSKDNAEKEEILLCLQELAHPWANKWRDYDSFEVYLKSGYQDQLDAVGLAIHCVKTYGLDEKPQVLSRKTSVKVYKDRERAEKFVKYPLERVSGIPKNQIHTWVDTCGKDEVESKSYLLETDSLGRFGVKAEVFEESDLYYIVVNVTLVTV